MSSSRGQTIWFRNAANIEYSLIAICLSFSLFIYLFYRGANTIVNEIYIACFSVDSYFYLKNIINQYLPLHSDVLIFSFPEGLWVLSTVLLSYNIKVIIFKYNLSATFLVLGFSLGLEILQLLHITNGQFDLMDVAVIIAFWLLGMFVVRSKKKPTIISPYHQIKTILLISCYAIVYLSDT